MLSFIYQLAHTFELEHGYPPNLLYLNPRHYSALMNALPGESTHDSLRLRLLDALGVVLAVKVEACG